MKSVSIRPAASNDIPFMWEALYEAIHWSDTESEPKLSREETFAAPEISVYLEGWGRPHDAGFIAVDGESGERLGSVWQRLMTAENPGYGFVNEETPEIAIAIVRESRGRGIGGLLVEEIAASARSSGYPSLSLSVERDNPAVRLYERCGFRAMKVRETDTLMKLDLT